MKLFYLFTFFAIFFCLQVASAGADCAIFSTLRVGAVGAEVACLQEKVGASADGKFGPLTKLAVVNFQFNKGLVADGIVGPLTRTALFSTNSITSNIPTGNIYPQGCDGLSGYSSIAGLRCDGSLITSTPISASPSSEKKSSSPTKIESNSVNMDKFIEDVALVSRRKGKSENEIKVIADILKTEIAKSDIDYKKKFEELLVNESKLSTNLKVEPALSAFDKIVGKTLSFFGINPPVALAQAAPFGGAVLFSFFCAYSGTWMIDITPLPPTGVVVLSYVPGTQGFASYNIPYTSWLLGTYTAPGVCIVPGTPLVYIPTEGFINPMVGSSSL